MILKRLFLISLAILFVLLTVNVVSAADSTVNSTSNVNSQSTISENEHIVIWEDNRDGYGTSHLYYKNLETGVGTRVSWVNSNQHNPTISGNLVVWEDNRDVDGKRHLYYKNLSTGVNSRVSWVNSVQSYPTIS